MRVGRSLLGASKTVARLVVLRDLGWRKLGERKEEKIVMVVADKLRMDRGIGWWEECLLLWMNYELDS